jgi:hypothetical protein
MAASPCAATGARPQLQSARSSRRALSTARCARCSHRASTTRSRWRGNGQPGRADEERAIGGGVGPRGCVLRRGRRAAARAAAVPYDSAITLSQRHALPRPCLPTPSPVRGRSSIRCCRGMAMASPMSWPSMRPARRCCAPACHGAAPSGELQQTYRWCLPAFVGRKSMGTHSASYPHPPANPRRARRCRRRIAPAKQCRQGGPA